MVLFMVGIVEDSVYMKSNNICKFVSASASGELTVRRFIYESDKENMQKIRCLDAHCMMLVAQGSGVFQFDSQSVPFEANRLVFGWQGERFWVSEAEDCEYMYISFGGERAEELLRRYQISPGNRSFENFDGMVPLWRSSLSRACEENIDLAAESMLLYAFSLFRYDPVRQNDLVGRMVQLTEARFNDPQLSIGIMAEMLGYNAKYLSHTFKEKMGICFSDYLRNMRINYAVNLFDNGIDSVKNVAILSGFSDPLYFSTVFKKQIGIPPTEYKSKTTNLALDEMP